MSDLQGKVSLAQLEFSSLHEQIDKDHAEKLALKHEICVLKNNLKNQDKDVEELRAEDSRQSDYYDELWKAHEVLLEETVIAFSHQIS